MADLFTIESPRMTFAWSGSAAPPGDGPLIVEPLGGPLSVQMGGEAVHTVDERWIAPLGLAEEAAYPVLLRSRTGDPVALHHRDPVVVGGMTPGDGGRVLHGAVSFGASAGASRFVVLVGGRPEVAFTVSVAPRKVTEVDVAAMQAEVETALAGLAARYLGPTALGAGVESRPPARPVWLAHLRAALPALEEALQAVAARPREILRRAPGDERTARITRPDAAVRRAAAKQAGGGKQYEPAGLLTGIPLRERLPARPLRSTLDTPEHRWLRARLEAAAHRLAVVRREEGSLPVSARRSRTLDELDEAAYRLRRLLVLPPIAAASGAPPPAPPLALHTAPGYAEATAALRRLDVGLALGEGSRDAVPRDLAGLYEVWSYLTVAHHLARLFGQPLPPGAVFSATARGVRLRLRQGRHHALRLRARGRSVRLAYQPRFPSPPGLLVQKPDLLLTVERAGAPPRLFVLDAKYRRDDTAAYRRRHGAPGPPEDALGDLHRYRDAIVTAEGGGVRRPVAAAVALFPYREPEPGAFAQSRLWTSIEDIGVGAVPLLPEATGYLASWLSRLLADAEG